MANNSPQTVVCGLHIQEIDGVKKLLLVGSQKNAGTFTGFLYPPGGKMEPGESSRETLKRELHEELGIVAIVGEHFTSTGSDIPGQATEWYFFDFSGKIRVNETEIHMCTYMSHEEIGDTTNIYPLTRCIADKLSKEQYL